MGHLKIRTCLWIFFILKCTVLFGQQEDSLQLDFSQLNWKDINSNEDLLDGVKVISGSRSEKNIADLPFTIFVITGEEIRKNGYLTLTDLLKRLPGIRVSQPGSALEGETFLMRGLLGNAYAKILINDMPIKPFGVSGLPIGAQLPIREAERVEVIYGPAATIYGADASAGIINIILKESERPIFVQADLGFGGDDFENLDIMFSGKLGKDKKVLKFQVFGSYTAFNDRRIIYDTSTLYNPSVYENIIQADGFSYLDRPNYQGTAEVPQFGQLPHLSNSLGIDLRYRNWKLSVQRFYRRDHSSIGLSPYAVSYANPLNYFGEYITNADLNYSKTNNRFHISSSLRFLAHQTDERSSYSYVIPLFNYIHQTFATDIGGSEEEVDSMRQAYDDYYFSGTRYSYAVSGEGILEVLASYDFNKNLELSGGLNIQGGGSGPLHNFSPIPYTFESLTDSVSTERITVDNAFYVDISSFLECYLNIGKWNAIVGAQVFSRQTDYSKGEQAVWNPRLALQYRFTDKFSLRASTGRSYRFPSPYYAATSYTVNVNNLGYATTGADLSPEETYSAEFGCRWQLGAKIHSDASIYYTRTSNFISYAIVPNFDRSELTIGYFNDNGSFAKLFGIQTSITFKDIVPVLGLSGTVNVNYAEGKEGFNTFSIDTQEFALLELDGLRSQPKWIAQLDIELQPFKRVRFLLENTFITKSLSRNILLYQIPDLVEDNKLYNSGYYLLDAIISYKFNKNLLAYMKINNFFDAEYAGIDATQDADGLLYNPQSRRFIRFGINYRLE